MPDDDGKEQAPAPEERRKITIGITLDVETWQFTVTGDVPRLDIGLMLARHLVYDLERRCTQEQAPRVLGAAPLDMGGFLRRNRG